MNNLITVKISSKIKETEKAMLLKIEEKNYWFPKSKINIIEDNIEIDKILFQEIISKETVNKLVEVYLKAEDYSEKVFKLILNITRENYKSTKFIFIPKSQVVKINDESLILPLWLWQKSCKDILEKEVLYYNTNFENKINEDDYNIDVNCVEL